MGNAHSLLEAHEGAMHRNFSQEHDISAWERTPAKNADYYNGNRFFKVDESMYRCYQPGWVYGYYEKAEPLSALCDKDALKEEVQMIKDRIAALAENERAL